MARGARAGSNFLVTMPTVVSNFSTDGDHLYEGAIKNLSNKPMRVGFVRKQQMPKGGDWQSSICFGVSCFSPRIDSASEVWQPGEERALIIHMQTNLLPRVDSGFIQLHLTGYGDQPNDTITIAVAGYFTPDLSFTSTLQSGSFYFQNNGVHLITSGSFTNTLADPITLTFRKDEQFPNANWRSEMAINNLWLGQSTDSSSCQLTPGASITFAVRFTGRVDSAADSGVVYLRAMSMTGNPNDTFQFYFQPVLDVPSGVAASKAAPVQPTIDGIYPHPLSALRTGTVQITAPRDCKASLQVSDLLGHQLLRSDLGTLHTGINEVLLPAVDVAEGCYMVEMDFEGFPAQSRLVQILR